MVKRQYGEGSIRGYKTKRGMRYEARWHEPSSPFSTESVRRAKGGFSTKKEAARYIRQRLVKVEAGLAEDLNYAGTVTDFLDDWLKTHRGGPSTMSGYRRIARRYVIPHVGNIKLRELAPNTLARMYRVLESRGGKDGRSLSPTTVLKAHQLLSVALSDAEEQGLIARNPAKMKSAKPPTRSDVKNARKPTEIWTPSQLEAFLDWVKKNYPDWYHNWLIYAHTGMRRGEGVALRGRDFDGRTFRLQRSVVVVKNLDSPTKRVTKALKSNNSRSVTVSPLVQKELKEVTFRPNGPIIRKPDGSAPGPDYVTQMWIQQVKEFVAEHPEVPYIRLHDLRHTHASHLIAAGVSSRVVQERLGHETHQITMDLYTHVMDGAQDEAIAKLEAYYERHAPTLDDEDDTCPVG